MAFITTAGGRQVEVVTCAPTGQLSTASTAVVTDSGLDTGAFTSVAYTVTVATQAIKWSVFGANSSDYTDEVAVQAATTVAAAASGSYTATPAPFRYYRVKIIDDSGGVHGTATVRGVAK